MGRFDSQIETAQRLIALNGQKIVWRQVTETANVDVPWKPGKGNANDIPDVSICFLPTDRVGNQLLRYLAKTDLVIGSEYGLMGAVNFVPSVKDIVIRGDEELRITAIDVLSPNGQILLYTIQFDA